MARLQPEEIGQIIEIPDGAPFMGNFERIAKARWPERYADIVRRYGAVEYIPTADLADVEDIASPVEYLKESDKLELDRWGAGDHRINKAKRPLTSSGLIRVIQGLLARSIAEWERLRNDPEYLYNILYTFAQLSPESIRDRGGQAQTPESLLAKPRYIGMRIRTTAHKILLEIDGWSVILGYLRDIEKLDREKGRFGALLERSVLMSQVKKLLDQILDVQFHDFLRTLVTQPEIRQHLQREHDHPDYSGARIAILPGPEISELRRELSTRGAMMRAISMQDSSLQWSRDQVVSDFSTTLARASKDEKGALTQELLRAWSSVEMITDLIVMLGTDGEDWQNTPHDKRYIHHATIGQKSEAIFQAAAIEKHIKSVESIKSEAKLQKIWADIDKISMKKEKKSIENLIGFVEIIPSWSYRPPPPPVALPPQSSQVEDEVGQKEKLREVRSWPPRQSDEIPEVEPVKLQPVSYLSDIRSTNDDEQFLEATSRGPKQKRRGAPGPQALLKNAQTQAQTIHASATKISKELHEVLQQLLVRVNRKMNWIEVEKALVGLGFGKTPTGGSCITFTPPSDQDIPFFVDRPHDHEMEKYQIRDIGKNLKRLYGWNIDMFTVNGE